MGKRFLVSVADAIGLHPETREAIFRGTAGTQSGLTLAMQSTQIRGGRHNPIIYNYMHDRELTAAITQATFSKEFLALNLGNNIVNSTVRLVANECGMFENGEYTLKNVPVGKVTVFEESADGNIAHVVTPTGNKVSVAGLNGRMNMVYDYMGQADRVSIATDTVPNIITLVLIAEVHDNKLGLVEDFQAEIPSFQIDGNYEMSLTADGVSTETLNGTALSVEGTSCVDGATYGYISWIPVAGQTVSVSDIAATPAEFTPAVADLPATRQLNVLGIRGGVYSNATVTDLATYSIQSGGASGITVSQSGLISVAAGATAGDSAIVEVEYDGKKDIVQVVVKA